MSESELKAVKDSMPRRQNPLLKSKAGRGILSKDLKALTRSIRDLPLATRASITRIKSGLPGTKYEKQAATDGRKILRNRLHLLEVELAFQPGWPGNKAMDCMTTKARESGRITEAEETELRTTGLIYAAVGYANWREAEKARKGKKTRLASSYERGKFIIAEVATTITLSHVERTRRRRKILDKVTGFPVLATVIGTEITPEAKAILSHDVTPVGMDAHGRPYMIVDANGRPNIRENYETLPSRETDSCPLNINSNVRYK